MPESVDLGEIAGTISAILRDNVYRPKELESADYRRIERAIGDLVADATPLDEFIAQFNGLWRGGPFSHVGLRRTGVPAVEQLRLLDASPAAPDAVDLDWRGDAAVLAVREMSGRDIADRIDAAYDAIVARAAHLVVDLRGNRGGAFGIVPLLAHLVEEPIDIGVFAVRSWYADRDDPPTIADMSSAPPWVGMSVAGFVDDVSRRPLTGYRILPVSPRFVGAVTVLTNAHCVSAGEIAAEALRSQVGARIVGEKTWGVVLSSRMFDVPGKLSLRIPYADYVSRGSGRLEGVGVTPDLAADSERALETAIATIEG